jgi:tripartite-type tricarboxylate transporter receptor subunit TctC
MIGHQNLAKAHPDGHTMLLTFIGAMAFSPYLYNNARYDPVKSFAPVILVSTLPNVLLVSSALPVDNLASFVALVKKNPGKYNYSSASTGTSSHLVMELFKEQAGIDIVHVPFKSATEAMTSVVTGDAHAHLAIPSPTVNAHIAAGKLKMLAVTGPKRYSLTPTVPTTAESGYPEFIVDGWNGVLVPAMTPAPVVERLNREINIILKSPDVVERLRKSGVEPVGGTSASFAAAIRTDTERWSRVIKRAGIRLD